MTIIICPELTWESSNPTVATINASGLVTGLSPGVTTITAKNGQIISNAVTVTVTSQKYKCVDGNCIEDDLGLYNSLIECQVACLQQKILQIKKLNTEIIQLEKDIATKETELNTKNAELRQKIIEL